MLSDEGMLSDFIHSQWASTTKHPAFACLQHNVLQGTEVKRVSPFGFRVIMFEEIIEFFRNL